MIVSPIVSIIIPVYNAEKYLDRCINSLICQSYRQFEVLLIDDGSSDSSGATCDEAALRYDYIRVYHQENRGVSAARNLGIDNAKGEWICFVDADDELKPNSLHLLLEDVSEGIGMVYGGYEVFDEDGNRISTVSIHETIVLSREEGLMLLFRPKPYSFLGYVWGNLYRTEIVRKKHVRFAEDQSFNEDRLFITQFICSSDCYVMYKTVPVYQYYVNSGSSMDTVKKSFNPKFATDLDGSIRMHQIITGSFPQSQLATTYAARNICASYMGIINMMKGFHFVDKGLKDELFRKLKGALPFSSRFRFFLELKVKTWIIRMRRLRRKIRK